MPEDTKVATLPPSRTLTQDRLKEMSFSRNVWSAQLGPEGQLEDVLQPRFWASVKNRMKPGEIVYITSDDHRFFAEAYVRATKPDVRLQIMRAHKLGVETPATPDAFEVKWNVGAKAFDVVRKEDKTVVKAGLPTREDAVAWVTDFIKKMAA